MEWRHSRGTISRFQRCLQVTVLYQSENCKLEVLDGRFYLHLNETVDAYEGFDYEAGVSLDTLNDLDLQMVALSILQHLEDGSSIE